MVCYAMGSRNGLRHFKASRDAIDILPRVAEMG